MKRINIVIGCFCILAFCIMPAQAFTMKTLTITVAHNGDAEMDMQYDLSLFEQSAVFFRIADPATELKSAFESQSKGPVTVTKATSSSAGVMIRTGSPRSFPRIFPQQPLQLFFLTVIVKHGTIISVYLQLPTRLIIIDSQTYFF